MSTKADVILEKVRARILSVTDNEVAGFKAGVEDSALAHGIPNKLARLEDDDIKCLIAVRETIHNHLKEYHEDNKSKT
jgi:ribosomal protein S15P/S13E